MLSKLASLFTGGLPDVIKNVTETVKHYFPSEQDRKRFELEMEQAVNKQISDEVDKNSDFVLDYYGRMKDVHKSVQIARGMQRPFIMYTFHVFVWASFLINGAFPTQVLFTYKKFDVTIMAVYVFLLVSLYFSRVVEKIVLKKTQGLV